MVRGVQVCLLLILNNDGLLDIYVCRVGNYETLKSNQFLICKGKDADGIPYFKDEAAMRGLDFQWV